MKNYLYKEYSEEELNEIIKNIGSKLVKLNKKYNTECYYKMMDFYDYLVNLKREKQLEKKIYERAKSNDDCDYIETDPVLKEYEKNMKEEMKKIEEQLIDDDEY